MKRFQQLTKADHIKNIASEISRLESKKKMSGSEKKLYPDLIDALHGLSGREYYYSENIPEFKEKSLVSYSYCLEYAHNQAKARAKKTLALTAGLVLLGVAVAYFLIANNPSTSTVRLELRISELEKKYQLLEDDNQRIVSSYQSLIEQMKKTRESFEKVFGEKKMDHVKQLFRVLTILLPIICQPAYTQDRINIDEVLSNAENEVKKWQHFEENIWIIKWEDDGHELVKVQGTDKNGKSANFLFFVLTQEIKWVCKSNNRVISGQREIDFAAGLDEEAGLSRLAQFDFRTKLISVGMASIEGDSGDEYIRARRRAETINGWLKSKLSETNRKLLILNLGKYKGRIEKEGITNGRGRCAGGAESEKQRRVLIIAVDEAEPGINLKEALQNGWRKANPEVLIDYKDYEKFDLT